MRNPIVWLTFLRRFFHQVFLLTYCKCQIFLYIRIMYELQEGLINSNFVLVSD